MDSRRWYQPVRLAALSCALLCSVDVGRSQDITAGFTSNRVATGEPVQFQISISGVRQSVQPPDISVDGLDVQYVGPSHSTQMRIENGRMTSSSTVTHIYQVTPRRAGTFTVPALEIDADGRRVRTQPVTLKVEKENAAGGSSAGGENERLAFAEFVVPKQTLYLGEAMPVELRLYIDSAARTQIEAMPIIGGEGFTKTKLTEPRQERARKDGREYDVYVFRTAITPSRAGKVSFGPSDITFNAQIRQQPQRRRDRPRSLLEEMLGNDPFDSFDPFFAPMRVQRVTVKAQAVTLDVKPLPTAGRPKNFSGAVGQFKLTAEGGPQRIKIGDVLTMKLAVSGRGNFDRVNAPEIVDSSGWRLYPATGQFKGEDELGISGIKSFEVAVIPEAKKTEMPRYEFSYFDPAADKYVAVSAGGGPIEVSGTPSPTAPPPKPPPVSAPSKPEPEPKSAPAAPADILGLRYDKGAVRTFTPLQERREFWLAQLAPAALLLGWLLLRSRRQDLATERLGRLRRERAELWRTLRRRDSDGEFLDAATRLVKIDTAIATGCSENSVDAAQALASRSLDPETAEAIERLFAARAELLYAGIGARGDALSGADRAKVLSTLEAFENSHARI